MATYTLPHYLPPRMECENVGNGPVLENAQVFFSPPKRQLARVFPFFLLNSGPAERENIIHFLLLLPPPPSVTEFENELLTLPCCLFL